MKIALAQLGCVVGDFDGNARAIREAGARARAAGARILLTPEMSICGYPAGDHLEDPAFLDAAEATLRALATPAEWNEGLCLVLGLPERHEGPGMGVFNAAAIADGGEVTFARKSLLPDYEVFDERRWFDPSPAATVVEIDGQKVGITICEDAWNDPLFHTRRRYARDPVAEVVQAGARTVLNLAASPYHRGKPSARQAMFEQSAAHHGVPVASVNLVGATDHLIFDGTSVACDGRGGLSRLPAFEPALQVVDLEALPAATAAPPPLPEAEEIRRALVLGIHDYLARTGFSDVLLGLSGGMDSALVAALAAFALGPDHVRALRLPSRYTSDASNDDAAALAERLGIALETLSIEGPVLALEETLSGHLGPTPPGVVAENLQARARGVLLMALSNASGALLLATSNKSELAVGYATLYGDLCGALAPIADLTKTRVYAVAEAVNEAAGDEVIPRAIFEKAPTAELRPGQRDSDTLPPYEVLDPIVEAYVEGRQTVSEILASSAGAGAGEATVRSVIEKITMAEYKRWQTPPILKVSPRPFGGAWRMPLAARWRPGRMGPR